MTFYIHGLVYTLVRVAVNVSMSMQPFYLKNVLLFQSEDKNPTPPEIAAVPLASYITSFLFTIFLQ
jgi:hypothetical protein